MLGFAMITIKSVLILLHDYPAARQGVRDVATRFICIWPGPALVPSRRLCAVEGMASGRAVGECVAGGPEPRENRGVCSHSVGVCTLTIWPWGHTRRSSLHSLYQC